MQNDYNAIHHAEIYSNGVRCIYIHCLENKQYQLQYVPKSCEFKVMGGFLGTFSDQFILTAHQFPYAHKSYVDMNKKYLSILISEKKQNKNCHRLP